MEIFRGFPSGPKGFSWISYLTFGPKFRDSFMYSQDVRGGNTFVKFHEHDPRNIIHMMIGHDTQWSKAPSCNRQEAKGCNYRVRVLFLPERNGTLTVRICRIISNPGYYTSKNHLERSRPELELHQASACLDPHGSSCPSHQMLHSSFCQSHENFIFSQPKRRSLVGRDFVGKTHIAEEDNLRHVRGLFCQQGGTSIRTWVAHNDSMVAASKKKPKTNHP